MEFIDKSDIMKGIGPDTTADLLEKAMGHKYFKREGSPGNYKYYYTEEQYNKEKGKTGGSKENKSSEDERGAGPVKVGQKVNIPKNLTSDPANKQGESGKVTSIDKDIITVKFSDGASGKYSSDVFEKTKIGDGSKKESFEKPKDSPESFNVIREWAGDHLKDEYIHSIIDSLKEDGIKDQNLKPKKTWSQEGQEKAILEKVKELKQSHRDGLEHEDMSGSDIEDVLWGVVKASMDGYKFFN